MDVKGSFPWRAYSAYLLFVFTTLIGSPVSADCNYVPCFPPYPGGSCGYCTYTVQDLHFETSDCYECSSGHCNIYDADCFTICQVNNYQVCNNPK
jgi:hypothetical protein